MPLSEAQQSEILGMPVAHAHRLRDQALATLDKKTIAAARKEWQDLAYRLRGGKGQPFLCREHPEAVRFQMIAALLDGLTIKEASDYAYDFAGMPA